MKPEFYVPKYGAQSSRSKSPADYITNDILDEISKHLTGKSEYNVNWAKERIKGRVIRFETDDTVYLITLSPIDNGGRNSYFQSLPTAMSEYVKFRDGDNTKKKIRFCFYILYRGTTSYHKFFYRVLETLNIKMFYRKPISVLRFKNVRELIIERNKLSSDNSGNNPTFITDEGECYHIYAKTFGANQKESTLLCTAIKRISDKPVKLFQIEDNKSQKLSDNDITTIQVFNSDKITCELEIISESYSYEEFDKTDKEKKLGYNLRSPRFTYNLLKKTRGCKVCTLCDCRIEPLIQAAHILPVATIKRLNTGIKEKVDKVIDPNNGLWLCENHHKLFDSGLIYFRNANVEISKRVENSDDRHFIKGITTKDKIDDELYTKEMQEYLNQRNDQYKHLQ